MCRALLEVPFKHVQVFGPAASEVFSDELRKSAEAVTVENRIPPCPTIVEHHTDFKNEASTSVKW